MRRSISHIRLTTPRVSSPLPVYKRIIVSATARSIAPSLALLWRMCRALSGVIAQIRAKTLAKTSSTRAQAKEAVYFHLRFSWRPVAWTSSSEHGVIVEHYRFSEQCRRNTSSPQIISFAELYERGDYIVITTAMHNDIRS